MIVVLCNESPWPVSSGGRVRMAGLIRALATHDEIRVVVARRRAGDQVVAPAEALPPSRRSRVSTVLGAGPRLGRGLLDGRSRAALREACQGAAALVVSHSYLAAELPALPLPVLIDLPNLEVDRQRSVGGVLGRLEAVKARRWEPRVVRTAACVVCVDDTDAERARSWGARDAVVVPNVAEVPVSGASPDDGSVLAVGDWRYGPNAEGLRLLLELAPKLQGRLVLVGRGSEPHGGLGFVEDVGHLYDQAAVVVSPVVRGGGTQLKIVEALTRGRVVVTSSYGARSVPPGAEDGCLLAEDADTMTRMINGELCQPERRHVREQALRAAELHRSWESAAAPLLKALAVVRGA